VAIVKIEQNNLGGRHQAAYLINDTADDDRVTLSIPVVGRVVRVRWKTDDSAVHVLPRLVRAALPNDDVAFGIGEIFAELANSAAHTGDVLLDIPYVCPGGAAEVEPGGNITTSDSFVLEIMIDTDGA